CFVSDLEPKEDSISAFSRFVSDLALKEDSISRFACSVSDLEPKEDTISRFACFVSDLAPKEDTLSGFSCFVSDLDPKEDTLSRFSRSVSFFNFYAPFCQTSICVDSRLSCASCLELVGSLNVNKRIPFNITNNTLASWINIPDAKWTSPFNTPINKNTTVATAKMVFCFIFRIVALESENACVNCFNLSAINTTSAVSIDISV